MTRPKKFTRNKDKKVDLIFNAFFDLVREKGYENVSTNHVAKDAGVSIGTVYRYFPEGKPAIIQAYFDMNFNETIDIEGFLKVGISDISELIEIFVRNHLKSHRENFEVNKALAQALISNRELFDNYESLVREMNAEFVKKLRAENEFFRAAPEERVVEKFFLIYSTLEAYVERHLYVMPVAENDENFVQFLKQMIMFIIQGLQV